MTASKNLAGVADAIADRRWTASHYTTDHAAQASAEQHVAEHHASRSPLVVSYMDDAYWDAVEA